MAIQFVLAQPQNAASLTLPSWQDASNKGSSIKPRDWYCATFPCDKYIKRRYPPTPSLKLYSYPVDDIAHLLSAPSNPSRQDGPIYK
jgi:hypothetical protein